MKKTEEKENMSNSRELKKHVALVHSTNNLTLLERKIANGLLYHAYNHLLEKEEHEIHLPYLCSLIGYDSKDSRKIKKSLMSLISTVLEWNLIDQDKDTENVWVASSILADAKIEGTLCTYSYGKRMRELCYYPKIYAQLDIQILSRYNSTYGIALHELVMRYKDIPQTPWLNLVTFRKLMGVQQGNYKIFRDLNKRVIKKAIIEVNNFSPIEVEAEYKKQTQGGEVTAIRFLIRRKSIEVSQNLEEEIGKDSSVEDRLIKKYGFSPKQAEGVIRSYGDQYLLEKMSIIENSPSYQEGKILHLANYLHKAIKDDFQPPKSSKKCVQEKKENFIKKQETKRLLEEKMTEYLNYQDRELVRLLENLPIKERKLIEADFQKSIKGSVFFHVYNRGGLSNLIVQKRFGNFVRGRKFDLLKKLSTFEDFCKKEHHDGYEKQ